MLAAQVRRMSMSRPSKPAAFCSAIGLRLGRVEDRLRRCHRFNAPRGFQALDSLMLARLAFLHGGAAPFGIENAPEFHRFPRLHL